MDAEAQRVEEIRRIYAEHSDRYLWVAAEVGMLLAHIDALTTSNQELFKHSSETINELIDERDALTTRLHAMEEFAHDIADSADVVILKQENAQQADEYRLQTLRANAYLDKLKVVKARLHEAERAQKNAEIGRQTDYEAWQRAEGLREHAEQRVAALIEAGVAMRGVLRPIYDEVWAAMKMWDSAASSPAPKEEPDGR